LVGREIVGQQQPERHAEVEEVPDQVAQQLGVLGIGRVPRDNYQTTYKAVLPGVETFAERCRGDANLIRYLESHGFRCVSHGDIATGQDALKTTIADLNGAQVGITNPPFADPQDPLPSAACNGFLILNIVAVTRILAGIVSTPAIETVLSSVTIEIRARLFLSRMEAHMAVSNDRAGAAATRIQQIIDSPELEPDLPAGELHYRVCRFLFNEYDKLAWEFLADREPDDAKSEVFFLLENRLVDLDCEIEDLSDKILELKTRPAALTDERDRVHDEYRDLGGVSIDALAEGDGDA
jgi:hypothetical protein